MRRKGVMKFETCEVDVMAAWNDWRIKRIVIIFFWFLINDSFLKREKDVVWNMQYEWNMNGTIAKQNGGDSNYFLSW